MSERLRQRWINIGLVVAVLGTFGVMAAYYFSRCDSCDCPSVEQFVRGFGPWGPLAFGLIYIISSPVPFLAPVLSAAGGLLFGTVLGTLLGIIPGTFSLVFLGAAVQDPTSWRFYAAIGLKIVTALIPVVAIFIRSRTGRQRGGARPQTRE